LNAVFALVLRGPKRISRRVRSFEILLVADSEHVAQALSATLRRAGHRVTSSTTIAGTVETLMRRGPFVDVIMTSMRIDSSLGDDVVQYSRKFAANARFIVLREMANPVDDVEDVERALIRQSVPERLSSPSGWN
jgi:DNA-binding NtrC family response regulator